MKNGVTIAGNEIIALSLSLQFTIYLNGSFQVTSAEYISARARTSPLAKDALERVSHARIACGNRARPKSITNKPKFKSFPFNYVSLRLLRRNRNRDLWKAPTRKGAQTRGAMLSRERRGDWPSHFLTHARGIALPDEGNAIIRDTQ